MITNCPREIIESIISKVDYHSQIEMRATCTGLKKIIDNSLQFSTTNEKVIRTVEELLKKRSEYNNFPQLIVNLAPLWNKYISPLSITLPIFNRIHALEKEIAEIEEHLPIAHLFGTNEEFKKNIPKYNCSSSEFSTHNYPPGEFKNYVEGR